MLRRIVVAVVLTAALVGGVAEATLTTLRGQNRGPQVSSAADLQDAGSVQRLGVALSSTGGTVVRILPDGVIVQPRRARGTLQRIIFLRGATILQRNAPTTAAAIELGAHVSVVGQAGASRFAPFAAIKIRITPHRHAIGGIILYISSDGHLTIQNTRRRAVYLVKVLPTTLITTGTVTGTVTGATGAARLPGTAGTSAAGTSAAGTPATGTREPWRALRLGQHVQVLAVHNPDPQQQDTYLADAIRVVQRHVSIHIGGVVRGIDPRANTITIYARLQNQTYTVKATRSTVTTLGRWPAGYADLFPGDHLTVSGYFDTADITGTGGMPNRVVARRIRIGSPAFAGNIVGLAARPDGSVVLDVRRRGRRSHLLRIVAPGRATVVYATDPARVLDLLVGERISARGARIDKFALLTGSIHVYPRVHTIGGTVTSIIPGAYHIVSATDGSGYIVRATGHTVYTTDKGQTGSTHPAIAVGARIRARGYDALHNDQRRIPRLIATHITILPRHLSHRTHRSQRRPSGQGTPAGSSPASTGQPGRPARPTGNPTHVTLTHGGARTGPYPVAS